MMTITAPPVYGGCRNNPGSFDQYYNGAGWWTATEGGNGNVYGRWMGVNYGYIGEGLRNKGFGFYVRCVEDN